MKKIEKTLDLVERATGLFLHNYQKEDMLLPVLERLNMKRNDKKIGILEAPTNSGKTLLSMLFPSIISYEYNSRENGITYILSVSTTTTALVDIVQAEKESQKFKTLVNKEVGDYKVREYMFGVEYYNYDDIKSYSNFGKLFGEGKENKIVFISMTVQSLSQKVKNGHKLFEFLQNKKVAKRTIVLSDEIHSGGTGSLDKYSAFLSLGSRAPKDQNSIVQYRKLMDSGIRIIGLTGTPTNIQDSDKLKKMSDSLKEIAFRKTDIKGKSLRNLPFIKINESIDATKIPKASMSEPILIPTEIIEVNGKMMKDTDVYITDKECRKTVESIVKNLVISNISLRNQKDNILAKVPISNKLFKDVFNACKSAFFNCDSNSPSEHYDRHFIESIVSYLIRAVIKDKFNFFNKEDIKDSLCIVGNADGFYKVGTETKKSEWYDKKNEISLNDVKELLNTGKIYFYLCVEKGSVGMDIQSFSFGAYFRTRRQKLNTHRDMEGRRLASVCGALQAIGRLLRVHNGIDVDELQKTGFDVKYNLHDLNTWEMFAKDLSDFAVSQSGAGIAVSILNYMKECNSIDTIYMPDSVTNENAIGEMVFASK
jgi:hypothetical protein